MRIAALCALLAEENTDLGPTHVRRGDGRATEVSEALLRAVAQCPLTPRKDGSVSDIAFDAAELRRLVFARTAAGASTLPLH